MKKIQSKIHAFRGSLFVLQFFEKALLALALALFCAEIGYLLDVIFSFSLQTKSWIAGIGNLLIVIGVGWAWVRAMLAFRHPIQILRHLEGANDLSGDVLQNAYEIGKMSADETKIYASSLLRSVQSAADQTLGHVRLFPALKQTLGNRWFRPAYVFIALVFVGIVLGPGWHVRALHQWLFPQSSWEVVYPSLWQVYPGNTSVLAGQNLTIEINPLTDFAQQAENAVLRFEENGETKFRPFQQNALLFRKVRHAFRYRVENEHSESPWYQIQVIEPPEITNIHKTIRYPNYTGLGTEIETTNDGNILALEGSWVQLQFQANNPLQQVFLQKEDEKIACSMVSDSAAQYAFRADQGFSYQVWVEDRFGHTNQAPPSYKVAVIVDEYPFIQLLYPYQVFDIAEDMRVPLRYSALDDFGISKIDLVYWKEGESDTLRQAVFSASERVAFQKGEFVWDLSAGNFFPEEAYAYYLEVFDNDTIHGPKSRRSVQQLVRFPSIEEIYQELEAEQDQQMSSMEEMAQRQQELRENLEDAKRKLMKKEDLTWQEKEELRKNLDDQEKLFQELEKMQKKYDELLENLSDNQAAAEETLEKMEQIRELMKDLLNPEMKKRLDAIREKLQSQEMNPQDMRKALEEMNFSQEEFQKQLERTLNLLKQARLEQKFKEMVKKAEEMVQRQEKLNNDSQNASQEDMQDLAAQQQDLQQDLDSLRQDIGELAEQLSPEEEQARSQLEQTQQEMDARRTQQQMQKAAQQMQQGQKPSSQQQESMKNDLQQFSSMLQNAQSSMQSELQRMAQEAFQKAKFELMQLSMEMRDIRMHNAEPADNIGRLVAVSEGIRNVYAILYEVAQKTFFLLPGVMKELSVVSQELHNAFANFEEQRRETEALNNEAQAHLHINKAMIELEKSNNNMNQGGGSGGMQSLMQQLQNMSQQQQMVNSLTQELMQKAAQQALSQADRAQMQRLQNEQQQLAQQMDSLAEELQKRKEFSGGRLDKTAEDMEDVARKMTQENWDRQIAERQKQILEKMLEAQRSMNEKGRSKKREAEQAEQQYHGFSGELTIEQQSDRLQQNLLEALKMDYPSEYQKLIKQYFYRLSEMEEKRLSE